MGRRKSRTSYSRKRKHNSRRRSRSRRKRTSRRKSKQSGGSEVRPASPVSSCDGFYGETGTVKFKIKENRKLSLKNCKLIDNIKENIEEYKKNINNEKIKNTILENLTNLKKNTSTLGMRCNNATKLHDILKENGVEPNNNVFYTKLKNACDNKNFIYFFKRFGMNPEEITRRISFNINSKYNELIKNYLRQMKKFIESNDKLRLTKNEKKENFTYEDLNILQLDWSDINDENYQRDTNDEFCFNVKNENINKDVISDNHNNYVLIPRYDNKRYLETINSNNTLISLRKKNKEQTKDGYKICFDIVNDKDKDEINGEYGFIEKQKRHRDLKEKTDKKIKKTKSDYQILLNSEFGGWDKFYIYKEITNDDLNNYIKNDVSFKNLNDRANEFNNDTISNTDWINTEFNYEINYKKIFTTLKEVIKERNNDDNIERYIKDLEKINKEKREEKERQEQAKRQLEKENERRERRERQEQIRLKLEEDKKQREKKEEESLARQRAIRAETEKIALEERDKKEEKKLEDYTRNVEEMIPLPDLSAEAEERKIAEEQARQEEQARKKSPKTKKGSRKKSPSIYGTKRKKVNLPPMTNKRAIKASRMRMKGIRGGKYVLKKVN